ncbi:uncharacterized protein LOC118439997 [Vespa mandarinia]|uniref:uncharacterized protein LOC118439997 n=1 Tax=Vespa mandarinia TaxID=7446 RepID=UPI00160E7350|nr:uncharacterized protein LOC118439997 [Vespa mandarinia]XP_035718281.1 uncharacterized protein LOC118439997 [Vespa mandarinia]
MTNANTIPSVRIDKTTSSNRSSVSDRSVVLLPYYEDQGSGSGREMLTTNEQTEDYRRLFMRQDDKRVSEFQEVGDLHEMNLTQKKFDKVIGRIDLRSFREIDSSYEKIADLQEFVQEERSMDPAFDVLLERRNSFNDENCDQNSLDAPDLVERNSIKIKFTRNCPYSKNPTNWTARNQSANMSITRKQQNAEKSFAESKGEQTNNGIWRILENDWPSKTNDDQANIFEGNNSMNKTTTPIPSIVVNDHGENSVLTILGQGNSIVSQATRTWPDSPLSCYNVAVSRSNSRCSSRAQSPGSGMQLESQLMPYNVSGSPLGSPQIAPTYTLMQGQSSPSSSSQSYGDTPSPLNYQTPLSQQVEERLHEDLACFSIWGTFPDDQGNITGNETINTFDSNELQLLDEVLRNQGNECKGNEEAQVVPRSNNFPSSYEDIRPSSVKSFENNLQQISNDTVPLSSRKNDIQTFPSTSSSNYGNQHPRIPDYSTSPNNFSYTYVGAQNQSSDFYGLSQTDCSNFYDYNDVWNAGNEMRYQSSNALEPSTNLTYTNGKNPSNETNTCSLPTSLQSFSTLSSTSNDIDENKRRCFSTSELSYDVTFNDFQIPKMVSSFKSNRPPRSNERYIVPWPSLNLPSVGASERLKEGLNPKDVEKAMIHLLKIPEEELAKADEDGDTELMRLVGNPDELAKKKVYLVPLVERLSKVKDALSTKNNRGEDALYLAAMSCPEMPYIAGYLAATMLQKGIDINQKLYHTRGDTLIHSVSARGDSHGEVLAELLALKTSQGNAVFDLSKCNYDGRTALHTAVESHDPTGRGPKAVATVRLLLDNGADLNIKDTKRGDTVLHMAAALSCDPALVKVLLSKASSSTVNATNYEYNTPLHMAAAASYSVPLERQKEVCWLLTQAGGQSNIHNKQGKTPLALVSAGRKDLIRRIFYKKF